MLQVGYCFLACVAVHMSIGNLHTTRKKVYTAFVCLCVCFLVSTPWSNDASGLGHAPTLTDKAKLSGEFGPAKLTGKLIWES